MITMINIIALRKPTAFPIAMPNSYPLSGMSFEPFLEASIRAPVGLIEMRFEKT